LLLQSSNTPRNKGLFRTSVSPFTIDSGVVILSRHAPSHRGRLVYHYVPGSGLEGFFCQKGAVWLDIAAGESGGTLRVLNTHLQSDVDSTCRVRPSSVRELQFQQLRQDCVKKQKNGSKRNNNNNQQIAQQEEKEEEQQVLMMGDLNIWRRGGDMEYNTAKAIMGLKGLEKGKLVTHAYTRNHFDYIWMTAERVVEARVQAHQGHGEMFISDHHGVEGEIVCL